MAKIPLDKYYTPTELAKYCIDKTLELFPNPSEIIEPSAGNGSFSLQIPNCIAYDIEPEHESIIKQDFLDLNLDYKPGRLIIGNPPFGTRNTMSVKFFKKSVQMSDFISFILPVSQYQNNQQMYEFDLVYSEVLPVVHYSRVDVRCCLNMYTRPKNFLLNRAANKYELNDVHVFEYRRGGTYKMPESYDFGMCAWGSIGKEVEFPGEYAQEIYISVNDEKFHKQVIEVMKNTDWKSICPSISTPQLPVWRIRKYLKEQIPELK